MSLISDDAMQRSTGLTAAIVTLSPEVSEMEELAEAAGFEVVYEVMQRKERPNASTFVGKGKFEILERLINKRVVACLLFNGSLKPKQHFNLENTLKVECVDRTGLVLKIFADKARDRKARLQVERARLEYEIPLLREWIHSAKMGEHPGFLGSGEYQVDVYYDLVRKRMRRIERELRSINQKESLWREQRRKRGFFLVSIAGYTNAGKSSLLKKLTNEEVTIDDKVFSTLSTTTRRLIGVKKEILLTDTIGFLHDLPHFMIESFMTTIEDIYLSDLILLMVDSSDPIELMELKLNTSKRILLPEVDPGKIIILMNKMDVCERDFETKMAIVEKLMPGATALPLSIILDLGVEHLVQEILEFFRYGCSMGISLPNKPPSQPLISHLYDTTDVDSIDYGDVITISLECREIDVSRISAEIKNLGGKILSVNCIPTQH
jgi:GTP-binding protein HflX